MAEKVKAEKAAATEEAVIEAVVVEDAVVEAEQKAKAETKAEVKKPAPKKSTRKPGSAAKKPEMKVEMILQYGDQEADISKIEDKIKAQFVAEGHRAGTIKSLNIYVKPEDYAAYYVINEKFSGKVDLF